MTKKEFENAVENLNFSRSIRSILRDYCAALVEYRGTRPLPVDTLKFDHDKNGNLISEDGNVMTDNTPFYFLSELATSRVYSPSEVGHDRRFCQCVTVLWIVDWSKLSAEKVAAQFASNSEVLDYVLDIDGVNIESLDDSFDTGSEDFDEVKTEFLRRLDVVFDPANNGTNNRFYRTANLDDHFEKTVYGDNITTLNYIVSGFCFNLAEDLDDTNEDYPDAVFVVIRHNGHKVCSRRFDPDSYSFVDTKDGAKLSAPLNGLDDGVDYRVSFEIKPYDKRRGV